VVPKTKSEYIYTSQELVQLEKQNILNALKKSVPGP